MIPTFTDYNEIEQCNELRSYFHELGADIKLNEPYRENEHLQKSLIDLINVLNFCAIYEEPSDVECILNSIVSLLIQVPHSTLYCQDLILKFCLKVCESFDERYQMTCIRVLQNLFEGLGMNFLLKYDVYLSLIEIAGKSNKINLVFDDLNKLNTLFNVQTVKIEKVQKLYRALHKALLENEQSEQASKVMIELLATYTEENASNAREDAQKCIIFFISDPNTFLMDHLLTLKPVKILEGEPIHNLLTIFVSEKLSDYIDFYESNSDLFRIFKLSHENNIKKMRILTFMQLAEKIKEIKFENIEKDLLLTSEEVEPFVVDILRTKLVKAKIDQANKRVLVTSTMHRTFGKAQWILLRDILVKWEENLDKVDLTLTHAIMNSSSMQMHL